MSFFEEDNHGAADHQWNHHDIATATAGEVVEQDRLRHELAAKDEAIFDLQVSLQAVEAEKAHEVQTLKAEHDKQVHLLQEQLRRAINEANVARMRASAASGGAQPPGAPPPNPSGNFPPPMMMSTRGGASSTNIHHQQHAGGNAVVATNDGRNAVVTPVAAAATAGTTAVNTHPPLPTAALPSSQHLTSHGINDGSGNEDVPREIRCVQSVRYPVPEQDLRLQETWTLNTRGEGPHLAGKILELIVAWNAGGVNQGLEAKATTSKHHSAEANMLNRRRRRFGSPSERDCGAGSSHGNAASERQLQPIQQHRLSSTPTPQLLSLPAHVVQTLVRWSRTTPGTNSVNVVTEEEVVMFCVEQVVSIYRQQLLGQDHQDINDSTNADPPPVAKASTPTSRDIGAALWKVLEWAIVLVTPRGRRHLRQNFAAAACSDSPTGLTTDVKNVYAESDQRDSESRGHDGHPQRRKRKSCIRSLKNGMGSDVPLNGILEVFRHPQDLRQSIENGRSGVMSRWDESVLCEFVLSLQVAVTRWTSPEISIPACRTLLLLLGQSSTQFTVVGDKQAQVDPSPRTNQKAIGHRDPLLPSLRMTGLHDGTWLWGLQQTDDRAACLLHAWEDAATRLIDLHTTYASQNKNHSSQQPRRRLTGSLTETASMNTSTVSSVTASVPKSKEWSDPSAALTEKNSFEPSMSQLLLWMSCSLHVFTSYDIIALVSSCEESDPTSDSSENAERAIDTSPLLLRRLLANILDVLEIVVVPRLEDATSASSPPSEKRASEAPEPFSRTHVDMITLMRFASRCAAFLANLARCDPPCPTVVTGSTHKTSNDRGAGGGRSAVSESLLVLLRAEMPTTHSTATSWDRAPSAVSVATGLLHAAAVLQESRDPYESAVAAPTVARDEEQKLIHALVCFFHQLLLQVQWERRWRTDQRKIAASLAASTTRDDASGNDESSSRTQAGPSSAKKRPLVSFWQLLSPCRHWYVTASALLRHASPNSYTSTILERDDDDDDGANPDNNDPHRRDGGARSLDEDVRFMLRLQMDELVDDEDEILQEH